MGTRLSFLTGSVGFFSAVNYRSRTFFSLPGNRRLPVWLTILVVVFSMITTRAQEAISFGTLIDEMTDLDRLTTLPDKSYESVQFSSYDRRSHTPGMKGWFHNADGFGGEPIPGFEKVLIPPDEENPDTGSYLMCDVNGPGVIVRLWTAGLNGNIRLYLDNMDEAFYEGPAEEFFWNTAAVLSDIERDLSAQEIYRQFDATYFPIPFSERCRIEWIGDIKKIHFYHVGIRLYDPAVEVKTFQPDDLREYAEKLEDLKVKFGDDEQIMNDQWLTTEEINGSIPAGKVMDLVNLEGSKAVDLFSLKVTARDLEQALRSGILNIYFDEADIPQVHAPVGDFFGAAPGFNPFDSYPVSVNTDGSMVCRFVMPFERSMRVEVENMSDETIDISGNVQFKANEWIPGKSMHFHARWRIDHGLTASNSTIADIPYLLARGKGRIVGAAALIYNPSEAVVSWGNWWGEGDEKIFIDDDIFPSFFGTGSEDYYNYSWSAEHFFAYPYCGQPRNDGPGNRGYVSNFRWHILDDIPFNTNIAFYMELRHHGKVPDFSYGRIVYAYALPGYTDDSMPVSKENVKQITYKDWKPLAYLGSRGFTFLQAENIVENNSETKVENGKLWSEGKILQWNPGSPGDELTFVLNVQGVKESTLGITLSHNPEGGVFTVFLNGDLVKFDGEESISLIDSRRTYLKNHFSEKVKLKANKNEIVFKDLSKESERAIGIDFFWLK